MISKVTLTRTSTLNLGEKAETSEEANALGLLRNADDLDQGSDGR